MKGVIGEWSEADPTRWCESDGESQIGSVLQLGRQHSEDAGSSVSRPRGLRGRTAGQCWYSYVLAMLGPECRAQEPVLSPGR